MLFIKVNRYRLEKAKKSPHLVPEKRSITRAGKTFMMTVWVDPTDKKKGKGKRSPVEDKTPSQMSLFDMGDLSGKPRKKETQKPKTKLGAFEYKLDGTTLMYKNPNADWKPLQDFYGSRDAEQALRGIQKYEDKGEIVNVREIPSHYLKTMINKVQAEKEADGYFATNPKGETEAEERAMAGYEVNGAKKQNKPEGKKTVEDDDRYNMTNKAWKVLNRAGEALEKNGKTYMKDKKLKEYREVKVSPDRMEVKNIYKERMDRVLNKLAAGELKSGDDLQKLSEQKEELEFVQNNLSNYKKKIKEIEDRGNLSVNLNELIMYMDFEDDALRRLEKVNEVSGPLLEKIEKEESKQATGKPKEKPEMSAGLDRIMNKPLDGLALRQLNKIIAEGKLEENVPDAKENMPMIMARIAEQEAKYKARSEELDKREEERAKRRQAEKDRVKNPAIIKDTDLKTPEEIKNRIVSITRQWNKINDLIETPSRKKQREKLSERKEYLEKKLKDQGMKKSIFSFAKNWIQGNR